MAQVLLRALPVQEAILRQSQKTCLTVMLAHKHKHATVSHQFCLFKSIENISVASPAFACHYMCKLMHTLLLHVLFRVAADVAATTRRCAACSFCTAHNSLGEISMYFLCVIRRPAVLSAAVSAFVHQHCHFLWVASQHLSHHREADGSFAWLRRRRRGPGKAAECGGKPTPAMCRCSRRL